MGAAHYTAVLMKGAEFLNKPQEGGGWVRVSEVQGSLFLGRSSGYNEYEATVPEGTVVGYFSRSNSGKASVEIEGIDTLGSFESANAWADGSWTPGG
jgi:hypothetical protein